MADERVRINDLPVDASPSRDDNVAIDRASTRRTTIKQLVAAALPIATEPQAREGLNDSVAMTPLKTAQAIETLGSARFATAAQGNLAATAVQPERSIAAGTGLSGGGDLSQNRTVALNAASIASLAKADSAVQPERSVSAGSGLTGGGTLAANITLALSSTSLASLALADTAVQPARKITAGAGLTGGGDFSADRTVALSAASIASLAKADTAVQPPAIANFATRAELTAGLGTKLDTGAQAADSAKLQGFTALTLPISTATQTALDGKATTVQGAKADTAVQPSDLGALATKSKVATTDIDATGSTAGGALLTRGGVWVDPSGGGDMFRATYDPNNKAADAFSMGSMVETTSAKVMTAAERTKLAGIATGATANTGTVTSVGVAVPAGLSATGAITTSGTITISYAAGYQGYTSAEASKLSGIAAGAQVNTVNSVNTKTGAVVLNATDVGAATSDQGAKADTALQAPGGTAGQILAKNSNTTNDVGWVSSEAATAVSYGPQTLTEAQKGQARANIGAGTEVYNWIINGDFTINQRGGVKKPANGVYGFDRWKGHASGIEQIIEALPADEYTLTWSGGGSGTFGGQTKTSPIKATVVAGNASVVVPATATKVSLVRGDATASDPWTHAERPISQELFLCKRFYEASDLSYTLAGFSGTIAYTVMFSVIKRVNPTMQVIVDYKPSGTPDPTIQRSSSSVFVIRQQSPSSVDFTIQWKADSEFY